jgi:hypothetical protein
MNPFFVFSVLFFLFFPPAISGAAYRIFLMNGQVITGVDDFTKKNKKITLYKPGIKLELQETSVVKIEQYEKSATVQERFKMEGTSGGELPEYQQYRERSDRQAIETPIYDTQPDEAEAESPAERIQQYEDKEEAEEPSGYKFRKATTVILRDGKIEPGPQLQDLRRREEEGTLPENFKPFKNFLENQFQKQKEHFETGQ